MKILEQVKWELETECLHCRAKLLVDEGDLKWGDFGVAYAGDHDWWPYYTCGACGCMNTVKDVPYHLKKRLREAYDRASQS